MLRSIKNGREALINTFLCAMVLVLIWSCLSFQVFLAPILKQNKCDTAFQCITRGVYAGVRGDMEELHGDDMGNLWMNNGDFPEEITQWRAIGQWLFVLSFFIIWHYILEGIIQGTIVDSFTAAVDTICWAFPPLPSVYRMKELHVERLHQSKW